MTTQKGRPNDPSWTIPSWDSSGNYPAGSDPWSGTAKLVTPSGTYFTPKLRAGAQQMNWVVGNAFAVDGSAKTAIGQLLNLVGQSPALNWLPKSTTSTHNDKKAVYCAKDLTWFAVGPGGNDFLDVSLDFGKTWTSLTASLGAVLALDDIACDAAGNIAILAEGSRTVYKGAYSGYNNRTWTNTPNALTIAPSAGSVSVDWDDTNSKFITLYRNAALGMRCDTSGTINAAWTNQTANLPAAWTGFTGATNPEITCIPGVAIGVFVDPTTPKYNIAYSTNGGATWTGVQRTPSIAAGDLTASNILSKPTYDETNSAWYFSVGCSNGGAIQTEIWKSLDNGVTWSQTAYFTNSHDIALHDLQALGDLLVGVNYDGRICYSTDGGVNFTWATALPGTSIKLYMRKGGGGLLVLNSADKVTWSSHRYGNIGNAV